MAGQLRITGGRLARRRFQVPVRGVRPTSDRAREALFSVLGDLQGLVVVDLCAGSGALGFEALSRGAAHATLVEQNRKTASTLRSNAQSLEVLDEVTLVTSDRLQFCRRREGPWDLVFLDPPYDDGIEAELFALLAERLVEDGRLVLERRATSEEAVPAGFIEQFDRTWGEARVRIFSPEPRTPPISGSGSDSGSD